MKVVVTGAAGQLGQALLQINPGHEICALRHNELDIADTESVSRLLGSFNPQLIINAAAYTAVDRAESEADKAMKANATGPEVLAKVAIGCGARFIHISTDFVFDGTKSRPYLPTDAVNPLGMYGRSKAIGEELVMTASRGQAVIIRTSWVYASQGQNFVKTILRLAREKEALTVIADQVGTPTWAPSLAQFVWAVASRRGLQGLFHWSDAGVSSWYDFAVAIQEEAVQLGLLPKAIPIQPITSEEYPLPAVRPAYSVLNKRASIAAAELTPAHWRVNLRLMLKELADA